MCCGNTRLRLRGTCVSTISQVNSTAQEHWTFDGTRQAVTEHVTSSQRTRQQTVHQSAHTKLYGTGPLSEGALFQRSAMWLGLVLSAISSNR